MEHHRKEDWECPAEIMRRHEQTITETKITLAAFMKRYENDRVECTERYKNDHVEAVEWREGVNRKLDGISDFLSEFKPNYKRIMAFAGIFVVGALATVFKLIWDHVTPR